MWGVRWARDLVRVMEAGGGGIGYMGQLLLCIIELIIVRSVVSYCVCRTCMYTIKLSYTYVLCYNMQEYGICSYCNRYLTTN